MNFLLGVEDVDLQDVSLFYLVAEDSEPHRFLARAGSENFITCPRNAFARILKEVVSGASWLRKFDIDIVYSYFGYAMFSRSVVQVSGSADSNMYFPEVDFWEGYRGWRRWLKSLVDAYRLYCVRRAHAVVFENPQMLDRARSLHGVTEARYIKPSICFDEAMNKSPVSSAGGNDMPLGIFVCGWHHNKNVLAIPQLAREMLERGRPMTFLITAPADNSQICRDFQNRVDACDVSDYVRIAGSVSKADLPSLYASATMVFLLSRLESFSNTILEAWFFAKPLVITDALWSRGVCGDAAVYVDRDDIESMADAVAAALADPDVLQRIVEQGNEMLATYPSIGQRIEEEMRFLRELHEHH